jgi:RNA polymerase sigma-70 factor, ECF subfamily
VGDGPGECAGYKGLHTEVPHTRDTKPPGIVQACVASHFCEHFLDPGRYFKVVSHVVRLVPRTSPAGTETSLDDDKLVQGLRSRDPNATAALVTQYGPYIRRVLYRVLGAEDPDHEDLVQDVLTRVVLGIGQLSAPGALRGWISQIAVFTARATIRRRKRTGWLRFFADLPERSAPEPSPTVREAARHVYRLLDRLPVDERIPFALRAMEGMDLVELANACGVSVATVRRRLARAEVRFLRLAQRCESLEPWVKSP